MDSKFTCRHGHTHLTPDDAGACNKPPQVSTPKAWPGEERLHGRCQEQALDLLTTLREAGAALRRLGHGGETPTSPCREFGRGCPGCAVLAKMEGR